MFYVSRKLDNHLDQTLHHEKRGDWMSTKRERDLTDLQAAQQEVPRHKEMLNYGLGFFAVDSLDGDPVCCIGRLALRCA